MKPETTCLACHDKEHSPDFQLADKLLTICLLNQIEPIICITKTDRPEHQADAVEAVYRTTGITMIRTNPQDVPSHERLREILRTPPEELCKL